jgi:hypothetical protein
MSVYDFNYQFLREAFLPSAKRKDINRGIVDTMLRPVQWLRDLFFDVYVDGFTGPRWLSSSTYSTGNRVRYTDFAVYEAIQAVPAATAPTNTVYWKKIQEVWIGLRERSKYHGGKLTLEYALNRWFDTQFRQPDDAFTPTPSDIYITTNVLNNNVFVVYNSNTEASLSVNTNPDAFVLNDYSFVQPSFTINVPLAVFNALASNDGDRERIIRQVADKYVIAGVLYAVTTY